VKVTVPVRDPASCGVNVTLTMQVACGMRLAGQLLVCANSFEPGAKSEAATTDARARDAVPVLVNATVSAEEVVRTICGAKVSVLTERVATGVPVKAVPESDMDCGESLAESVSVIVEVRVPAAMGVKVRVRVQDAKEAKVAPQPLTMKKSVWFGGPSAMEVNVRVASPELVIVTVCDGEVVPTCCEEKVSEVRDSWTGAAGATVPVPVMGTSCGEPAASSDTEILATRVPTPDGVNIAERVQVALMAKVAPQPLVRP
jgi:hypothetical protein